MALGVRMVAKSHLQREEEGTCFEKSSYVGLHSIYLEHYELHTCSADRVKWKWSWHCHAVCTLRPVSKLEHSDDINGQILQMMCSVVGSIQNMQLLWVWVGNSVDRKPYDFFTLELCMHLSTDSVEILDFVTVFIAHLPHRLYSAVDCLEVSCQLLFSMPCHWQQQYIVYSLVVELYVQRAVLRFLILPPSPLSVPCRRRRRDLWPVTVALCSLNCLKPCPYPVDHCAVPAAAVVLANWSSVPPPPLSFQLSLFQLLFQLSNTIPPGHKGSKGSTPENSPRYAEISLFIVDKIEENCEKIVKMKRGLQ